MRVLLHSIGSRGDLQPVVALGVALIRAGHEARIVGSPNGEELSREHGVPFVPTGVNIREWFGEHAGVVVDRPAATTVSMAQAINEMVPGNIRTLLEQAEGCDIVVGCGVVHAAATAAEAAGLPYRYLAYCSQFLPSRLHPPYVMPVQTLPGWANRALWRSMDLGMALGAAPTLNRERAKLGLPSVWRMSEQITPPGRVILATCTELAPPPMDFDPALPVAEALHLPTDEPLPHRVEAFLEDGPAPLYVGFGSITDPHHEETTDMIVTAAKAAGVRVLISRGWAGLGESPHSLPPNCMVVGPLPHDTLFPRVAGVIHHGGAGTTTTAARAGRPQLIVPHLLDQFYWARHVYRVGLGPRPIRRRHLDVPSLAAAMRQLVEDHELARRAEAFGAREQQRDGAPRVIQHLADAIEAHAEARQLARRRARSASSLGLPLPVAARLADPLSSMGD
ncbi:MAG: glycosyltransferase family 1 protein [Alphaproteobacteria bacterium]|nr:glycosyltransferase family 1 protein [Alphaproteobacteria bacterium]